MGKGDILILLLLGLVASNYMRECSRTDPRFDAEKVEGIKRLHVSPQVRFGSSCPLTPWKFGLVCCSHSAPVVKVVKRERGGAVVGGEEARLLLPPVLPREERSLHLEDLRGDIWPSGN
ncbi:uncharacterized protein [Triticum aestivum]|uniref:uncharacterized protein isoform X3 n=1 Tax=Triticum aestivum TaxID=4565 RepID=UPI001D0038C8|nr:uncharacterized protein LOC123132464 isoform X3 [Triticum aestivum]